MGSVQQQSGGSLYKALLYCRVRGALCVCAWMNTGLLRVPLSIVANSKGWFLVIITGGVRCRGAPVPEAKLWGPLFCSALCSVTQKSESLIFEQRMRCCTSLAVQGREERRGVKNPSLDVLLYARRVQMQETWFQAHKHNLSHSSQCQRLHIPLFLQHSNSWSTIWDTSATKRGMSRF